MSTIKVTYGRARAVQELIGWGSTWYDAACEWAARHGWRIESQTPGRRIRVNGVWYAVSFSELAGEWQFTQVED